jgi:hypothetical protein
MRRSILVPIAYRQSRRGSRRFAFWFWLAVFLFLFTGWSSSCAKQWAADFQAKYAPQTAHVSSR